MNIEEKLLEIQINLKAKKSQLNKFGGYNYRSLEDIYEAVKPLLKQTKTNLRLDNDLEVVNGVIFRKSIATLTDTETGEKIQTHTLTQETLERKGMSSEQCSGSVASYSDKYCLNKLFCIDDAKDADTNEVERPEPQGRQPVQKTEAKGLVGGITGVAAQLVNQVKDGPILCGDKTKSEPPARVRRPVATEEKKPEAKKEEVKTDTKTDNEDW